MDILLSPNTKKSMQIFPVIRDTEYKVEYWQVPTCPLYPKFTIVKNTCKSMIGLYMNKHHHPTPQI